MTRTSINNVNCWIRLVLPQLLLASTVSSFHPLLPHYSPSTTVSNDRPSSTELHMVFDFFRKRSQEGIDQLGKLTKSAAKGELGKGLTEVADYTRETNQAFVNGLAKSRNRLLQGIETLVTGVSPEDVLEDLQDILLQADLGTQTAEDIVNEVKSLREDSTKMLSKSDLKSIMRGKIIQALETGQERSIRFSDSQSHQPKMPTVLFIMGANGMGKCVTTRVHHCCCEWKR
jgi:signal recognition particle GTPase